MKKTILGFILLFTFLTLTGCGVKQVDVADFLEFKESGSNENGKLEVTINSDIMASKQFREAFKDKLNISHLSDAYKITITPSKSENLSNGDTVDLNLSYNKDLFKDEFNVELVNSKKTYTIENLPKIYLSESDLSKTDYIEIKSKADKSIDNFIKEEKSKMKKDFTDLKFIGAYIVQEFDDNSNNKLVYLYNANEYSVDLFDPTNKIKQNIFIPVNITDFKFSKNGNLEDYKVERLLISKSFEPNSKVDINDSDTLRNILSIPILGESPKKLNINFNN
ncbi:MAG: hypothetical protein MJH09_02025 [Cetobacterium sp.]|nr:hypothetical protein [Cetobacterium sp.]